MGGLGGTHEFEVCFDAAEDQAVGFGGPEFGPFLLVGGVDGGGEVLGPVYARGFGVAGVGDVVDVALGDELEDDVPLVDGVCSGLPFMKGVD